MDPDQEEITENPDDRGHLSSDEGDNSETVLGLTTPEVSESPNVDEILGNQAVVAANLIASAAEEATGKTDQVVGENPKKLCRPRVLLDAMAAASGSCSTGPTVEGQPMKKAKKGKVTSELSHPSQGPHKCYLCGKGFLSLKAMCGHLNSHKDRGYQGLFPPPTFNVAEEGFGGTVAASSGGDGSGVGTRGLRIVLNAGHPMKVGEGSRSGSKPRFDLNRSPPQEEEEEEEEEENKEDKAE